MPVAYQAAGMIFSIVDNWRINIMNKIFVYSLLVSIVSSVSYANDLLPQAEINEHALTENPVNSAWLDVDKGYFALDGRVDVCELDPGEIRDCKTIVTDFTVTSDVIVRNVNAISVAYIAGKITQSENVKSVIYVCPLDKDGYIDVNGCKDSEANMGEMSYTGLQLHPNKNRLYATNYGAGQVTSCALNADGTIDKFKCDITLAINDAGFTGRVAFFESISTPPKLYAYIASYIKHNLYFCEVQENTAFTNCQRVFYDHDPVAYASGVSVQGTTLYVPHKTLGSFTPAVRVCSVDPGTGAIDIDNCKDSVGDGVFDFSGTVTNLYVNEQWAYIPNSGGGSPTHENIFVCNVAGLDLDECVAKSLP